MPGTASTDPPPDRNSARLRIIATTDVHVHLMGYDYYADRPDPTLGLAHAATLIAAARSEVANSLLLDNGDFLQGNPMGDYVLGPGLQQGRIHPAVRVMNRLGYDAATLGNHEFNYGLPTLTGMMEGARFPFVSANIAWALGPSPAEDVTFVAPHALITREITLGDGRTESLRIGIIGFAPPQIVEWDRPLLEGRIFTRDIVETAKARVPELRASGADVVIALSHSGIGTPMAGDRAEDASSALAQVAGIDAIIAGHSHLLFPSATFAGAPGVDLARGTIAGVPVVMPGFNAMHIGVIDLQLERHAGRWTSRPAAVSLRSITPGTPALPEVVEEVRAEHSATVAFSRRSVGRSLVPLDTFFATATASAAMRVVAEAQARHVARQVAGRTEAALPIVSAVSPLKAGGRGGPQNYTQIPAGDLALRHVADLYIFPNTIAALRLTGAELADWLENAVTLFHQIQPGAVDVPLIDADFPCYNHDRILGLSFEIDLSQPSRYDRHGRLRAPHARRVHDLRHNGLPLDPNQEFLLATNSYRSAGCGGYAQARPERLVDVGRAPIRDILLRHLAEHEPTAPAPAETFRFRPMPGTTVTYDTAPAATAHLDRIAHFRPEPLGLTDEGFARFRLHL